MYNEPYDEAVSRCREVMPLPDLMAKLGKGEYAKKNTRSPFRQDNKPSFSVFFSKTMNRWIWKDHGLHDSGDEVEFLMQLEGYDRGGALRFYKELCGIENNNGPSAVEVRPSYDWTPHREAFDSRWQMKLHLDRGYSLDFCEALTSKNLIGLVDGKIGFPVMDMHQSMIQGAHVRGGTEEDKRFYYTKGARNDVPLIMGNNRTARSIYAFESQWDMFAAADAMGWLPTDQEAWSEVAFVCTRGASSAKSLGTLNTKDDAMVILVPQNDTPKADGSPTASDKWTATAIEAIGKLNKTPYIVTIPKEHKDFNDWTRACESTLDLVAALEKPTQVRPQSSLPAPDDGTSFVEDDIPLPLELVQGVLHKGTKMVLGGPSKAYKTWALLDLAVSVASGKDWWSFPCKQGKVIYLNFEIPRPFMRQRLAAICLAKGVKLEPGQLEIWNLRGHAGSFEMLLKDIIAQLKLHPYVLVIIDPTYKVMGDRDENSASDMNNLMNTFEQLCTSTGVAVAFGSHFAKGNASGKEAIDRISGSGVTARDPDSIITLTRHSAGDAYFTADFTLRNFPRVDPFVVFREHPLMSRVPDLDPNDLKRPERDKGEKREKKERVNKSDEVKEKLLNVLSEPLLLGEWAERAVTSGVMFNGKPVSQSTHMHWNKIWEQEGVIVQDAFKKWSKT